VFEPGSLLCIYILRCAITPPKNRDPAASSYFSSRGCISPRFPAPPLVDPWSCAPSAAQWPPGRRGPPPPWPRPLWPSPAVPSSFWPDPSALGPWPLTLGDGPSSKVPGAGVPARPLRPNGLPHPPFQLTLRTLQNAKWWGGHRAPNCT